MIVGFGKGFNDEILVFHWAGDIVMINGKI